MEKPNSAGPPPFENRESPVTSSPLNYHSSAPSHPKNLTAFVSVATLAFSAIHLVGGSLLEYEFFRLAGGVHSVGTSTEFGGTSHTLTNLAWLPGAFLLSLNVPVLPAIGMLLLLIGSICSGYALSVVAGNLIFKTQSLWLLRWRIAIAFACWLVWVPVPVQMTFTYVRTVLY